MERLRSRTQHLGARRERVSSFFLAAQFAYSDSPLLLALCIESFTDVSVSTRKRFELDIGKTSLNLMSSPPSHLPAGLGKAEHPYPTKSQARRLPQPRNNERQANRRVNVKQTMFRRSRMTMPMKMSLTLNRTLIVWRNMRMSRTGINWLGRWILSRGEMMERCRCT